jgi:pyruvate kinase
VTNVNAASCGGAEIVDLQGVLDELLQIRSEMIAECILSQRRLDDVHPNYRESAQNLLHYLVLRRRDLRPLQSRLAALGLSSLGRAEPHVLATVDAVLKVINQIMGTSRQLPPDEVPAVGFADGRRLLAEHTEALLGAATPGRSVRIMVTMPGEAAGNYALVHELLQQGMNCMRINCAHDDRSVWARMIEHLRRAEQSVGRSCRVVMDLAGPKLRTGPLQPGPAVLRIRPQRDAYGRVTAPARVWLTAEDSPSDPPSSADAVLPVPSAWMALLRVGEKLRFRDARKSKRTLKVIEVTDKGLWTESGKTAYVVPGTVLIRNGDSAHHHEREASIGSLPPVEGVISLKRGDLLMITRNLRPGHAATLDSAGNLLSPASIGCTIPEVFDDVRPGESIWFDDGKIGGIVEKIEATQVLVRVRQVSLRGEKLRGDKGINIPESNLGLLAMTDQDKEDLPFVAANSDVVELSFSNTPGDVELLQQELSRLRSPPPAVVLKIETRRGFENLPDMLMTAMRAPCCGVMIARGDLAVECGFERMAEVQEEILWICEAAHVPVIWATQVLETLAKDGMPSRAEITDAAMGDRAECVMLNKGPHIVTAVKVLDNILRRMQTHQEKKRSMLRALRLAHALGAGW